MSVSARRSSRAPFFTLFLIVVLVAVTVGLAYRGWSFYRLSLEDRVEHPEFRRLRPSGMIGNGYGWVAAMLVVMNLSYLVRRRFGGARLGSMRVWLDLHVFTGLLAASLVSFHSAFQLRTPIAAISAAQPRARRAHRPDRPVPVRARTRRRPRAAARRARCRRARGRPATASRLAEALAQRPGPDVPANASLLRSVLAIPAWRRAAARAARRCSRGCCRRAPRCRAALRRGATELYRRERRGCARRGRDARCCDRGAGCIASSRCSCSPPCCCTPASPGTSATGGSSHDVRPLAVIALVARRRSPRPAPRGAAAVAGPARAGAREHRRRRRLRKCHESGKQVVARLCLDCHKDLGAELAASRGLHGKQYKGQAVRGLPRRAPRPQHASSMRWPGGAMEKLDHALTGWTLDGGHTKVACLKCHTKTSPLGKPQFVGTKTACGGCHKDPHAGRFGDRLPEVPRRRRRGRRSIARRSITSSRASAHRQARDRRVREVPHRHAAEVEAARVRDLRVVPRRIRTRAQFKPKPCTDVSRHRRAGTSGADKMRDEPPQAVARDRPRAGRRARRATTAATTSRRRRAGTCASCHQPVHLATFGTRCESCHASIKWVGLPESIGRDNHGKTRYPLAGKHTAVACARCHADAAAAREAIPRASRSARAWPATPTMHKGEFAARKQGECAQCHTVAGFAPTTFGIAEHATTKFALDGKHVATPCSGVPPGAPAAARLPRRQAAVRRLSREPARHAVRDRDGAGRLRHVPQHRRLAPAEDRSLDVAARRRARADGVRRVSRRAAAGRPARGVSAASRATARAATTTSTPGSSARRAPIKDCKTCHDATTFKIGAAFDHGKTRLPARRQAPAAPCAQCHAAETLRNGSTAVRWRLGYQQCKDCHANPHREAP